MENDGVVTAPQLGGPSEKDTATDDSSLANPFLANIPESDRPIVEKYVKDWDAGVTKKFQDYSEKLKTYEEFGDIEEIRTARVIMQELAANPVEFIARTQEYINSNPEMFKDFQMEQEEVDLSQYGDLPEEFASKYAQTETTVQELQRQIEEMRTEQETQEQFKMLDAVMDDLHNTHGSFNDDFVLLQIANGSTPEEAIQAWEEAASEFVNSRKSPTAPSLLPGQGGTPLDQVDKSKLRDPGFRKEYGAELLRAQLGR